MPSSRSFASPAAGAKLFSRAATVAGMALALVAYTNCVSSSALVAFYGYGFRCSDFNGMAIFTGAADVVVQSDPNNNTYDSATPVTVTYDCTDMPDTKDGVHMSALGTLAFSAGGDAGRALVRAEVALKGRNVSDCSSTNACNHALRDIPIIANTERNVSMTIYADCSGGLAVCQKNGTSYQTCVDRPNSLTVASKPATPRTAGTACAPAVIAESRGKIDVDPDAADPNNPPVVGSSGSNGNSASGSAGSSSTSSSSTSTSTSSGMASTSTSSGMASTSTSSGMASTSSSTSSASSTSSSSSSSSSSSTSASSSSGVLPMDGGGISTGGGDGGL